jgi:hypothetical protein
VPLAGPHALGQLSAGHAAGAPGDAALAAALATGSAAPQGFAGAAMDMAFAADAAPFLQQAAMNMPGLHAPASAAAGGECLLLRRWGCGPAAPAAWLVPCVLLVQQRARARGGGGTALALASAPACPCPAAPAGAPTQPPPHAGSHLRTVVSKHAHPVLPAAGMLAELSDGMARMRMGTAGGWSAMAQPRLG